jgi:hypothetical protein
VPPKVDGEGYGLRVPSLVISPYAKTGYVDHQDLSFDAMLKFVEDDFLGGSRLDPKTDGRPDPRPDVRENAPVLGDLTADFDFNQTPRAPEILKPNSTGGLNLIGPGKVGQTGTNPVTTPTCPAATGDLSGNSLGPVVLGASRTRLRRTLTPARKLRNQRFDEFCLPGGAGARVGYVKGAAALAMTTNPYYSYGEIRVSTTLDAVSRLLGSQLHGGYRRGASRWYTARSNGAVVFLRVRAGIVREIGIGSSKLARTPTAQRRLLAVLGA